MDASGARALWAILNAVSQRGVPDYLTRILQVLRETIGADRVTLHVLSRRRGMYVPAADSGTPEAVARRFLESGYVPGTFPQEDRLRAGEILIFERGKCIPELEAVLANAETYSLALLPITHDGEPAGALSVAMDGPPGLTAEQIALVEQLAAPLGLMLSSVRTAYEQTRLTARRKRLANLATEVLTASAPDVMAMRLCTASRSVFRATRADLLMVDGDVLEPRGCATAPGTGEHQPLPPRIDDAPLLWRSLRERRVIVVNDFMSTPYANTRRAQLLRPAAVMAIPLADDEGDLGLVVVSDRSDPFRFGPRDEEDARLIATIATDTIRKSLLVESLRRASAAKSEFLASVSHDLRTPLNVIVGYTDLLAEEAFGPVTAEQLDTLSRMRRTAVEQLGLINDLLDLARIEQGKLTYSLRPVHVGELVASLREMMDALLRDRPIAFEVDVATDAVARTDRERLRQVLVNLLANAAKFTHHGRVRLAAARRDDVIEILVDDTGTGMDPAVAQQVLEPFVRGTDVQGGSGLGLAIVSRLLAVLGGTLAIDSAPGRGTTVRVSLPADHA